MQTEHNRTLFIVYYDLGIGGVQRKIVDIVNYIYENPSFSHTKFLLFWNLLQKLLSSLT